MQRGADRRPRIGSRAACGIGAARDGGATAPPPSGGGWNGPGRAQAPRGTRPRALRDLVSNETKRSCSGKNVHGVWNGENAGRIRMFSLISKMGRTGGAGRGSRCGRADARPARIGRRGAVQGTSGERSVRADRTAMAESARSESSPHRPPPWGATAPRRRLADGWVLDRSRSGAEAALRPRAGFHFPLAFAGVFRFIVPRSCRLQGPSRRTDRVFAGASVGFLPQTWSHRKTRVI